MAPATDNSVPVLSETKSKLKVIAFALDLTGKKLIDEICHISACHESGAVFDQYIMTHRDISRSSIRSHGIRIFTMLGKYRVLKDTNTMKSIHTKSEYSALNDFISWLTEQKGQSEGLILAYHDSGVDRVTPFLMEALERYKLTDEFFKTVRGFVNCATLASTHPDVKGKSLALRSLARRLLGEEVAVTDDKETKGSESDRKDGYTTATDSEDATKNEKKEDGEKSEKKRRSRRISRDKSGSRNDKEREKLTVMQSAKFRAVTTYKLFQKFAPLENEVFGDELFKFVSNQEMEIKTMEKQRTLAKKVRSLRPIFVSKIRTSPKDRSKAVLLRRYLIEAELDYDALKSAFDAEGQDGILKIVEETAAKKKQQHQDELVEIIMNHFKAASKKDVNANDVKGGDIGGAGDHNHCDTGSSTDSDTEEFEEAHGDN